MTTIQIPANDYIKQLEYEAWKGGEKVEWIDALFALLDEQDARSSDWKRYQVDWEPAKKGDWELVRESIPRRCYERIHHVTDGPNASLARDCGYGPITALRHEGRVWMSDTRAEILEHAEFLKILWWHEPVEPRVLINGLGLGMAAKAALTHHASHVDVVEIDGDVIDIIAPNFAQEIEQGRLTIHHADAYEMVWPRGTTWSLAWHDIWPTIDSDNLAGMERLHRKYGGRVNWQASWQREGCQRLRANEKKFAEALERGDWKTAKRLEPNL
jgi:hypothetical protein